MTSRTPRSVPAAVYRRRGETPVEMRDLPPVESGQVLIEVAYCGVCGSDLHLIDEGWGTPGDVLGHEWSGVVVTAGADVDLSPGTAVVGGPSPKCGACPACAAGRPSQCENNPKMTGTFDGAFATHVVRDVTHVLPVPAGLDLRTAALVEPLAVALHAINRGQVAPGNRVLISGAGPIGALAAAVLVDRGHHVVVVEPAPTRQELGRALGVAAVRRPEELPMFNMAQVDTIAEESFHVAIETSGKRVAMETAFQQLQRGGRLVLVGTGMEQPSFDPNRTIVLELTVCGSFVYDDGGFETALELLAAGTLPTDALIDQVEYGLDGVAEAVARLARGEHAGKVMVRPDRLEPT
ncbi:MAG: zinc-binding dehydrogenase [Actinobacteria bacterium]|nr:zinc-binding dehydrogenase [Actinomycetota bacterium]